LQTEEERQLNKMIRRDEKKLLRTRKNVDLDMVDSTKVSFHPQELRSNRCVLLVKLNMQISVVYFKLTVVHIVYPVSLL